ncbi:MAG: FtsW/RodA/SpoVE family cell cycle protein [Clostridiales bacterium]|nr:FtsW/RodA/SpoVE family cell cycle protein [Clostridiales bacterium]
MNETTNGQTVTSSLDEWKKTPAGRIYVDERNQILSGIKLNKVWPTEDEKKTIFMLPSTVFIVLTIILLTFGLIMCYSAGMSGDEIKDQLFFAAAGLVLMVLISICPVRAFKYFTAIVMVVSFFVLLYMAAKRTRWLYIAGHSIQPSDFIKVAVVSWYAYVMDKYKKFSGSTKMFWILAFFTVVFSVLVLAESHLSGAILFFLIGAAMMTVGGQNKKWLVFSLVAIAVIAVFAVSYIEKIPISAYQKERIVIWKQIMSNKEFTYAQRIGNARQSLQSLYGISTGGLFGKGFGLSAQKYSNLSEASNDFIFSIIAEELGFIPSILIMLLFGFLVAEGFRIAKNSRTYYGSLLAFGLSFQIALQTILNIAVATAAMPNTGIGLPFFSAGGSSMISILVACGMVLAVSKDSVREKKNV